MDLHTHLPYRIANLSMKIGRSTTERFVQHTDIGPREWRALIILGVKGKLTPSDLSSSAGVDRATVTRAAERLSKMELVRRIPNAQDNRSFMLELTAKGLKRYNELVPKSAKSSELCAQLFSPGEFALLIEFLDRLDRAVSDGIFEKNI